MLIIILVFLPLFWIWIIIMGFVACRAAAIPRAKGGTLLQMKLVCNQLTPLFLLFLQWMDCSCAAGFLHRYLNLFHILIYKVSELILRGWRWWSSISFATCLIHDIWCLLPLFPFLFDCFDYRFTNTDSCFFFPFFCCCCCCFLILTKGTQWW